MKKILVIRYRFIGDTILTIPFLRNLRYSYPDAQIDMLVSTGSGEIINNCPYVNNFIYFDTTKKFKYENGEKKSFWSYVKILRQEKYDKVYILKRSLSSAILAFLTGARERIGFDTENRGLFLTKKVPYDKNKHEIESFLDILRADNIKVEDTYLEYFVDENTKEKIKEQYSTIPKDVKKVIVHATASTSKKEISKEKWAEVIEYLSNKKSAQVIFLGAQKDKTSYEEIIKLIKKDLAIKPLNFCGEFNLQESLEAINQTDLMVGIDSGNLHMAASARTRVIGIYGPMNEKKWGAYPCKSGTNILLFADVKCRPCGLKKKCKKGYECLNKISTTQIKEAIDKIL